MLELIRPDWKAPGNVCAFTTTRNGGVSEGPWSSLNLGDRCGDNPEHLKENRDLLKTLLPGKLRWLTQVHGDRVVNWRECGNSEADAIVSRRVGQVCVILTADCLPVLLCNRAGTEVAACHAGWRGLAAGILEATIAAMNSKPGEIIAWLGPAIGPRAYEVGQEVHDAFVSKCNQNANAFRKYGERWLVDLYQLAKLVLQKAGVSHVSGGQYCTFSEPGRFFSYRRDGITGRIATMVCLSGTVEHR